MTDIALIQYLNTDLELVCKESLQVVADELFAMGLFGRVTPEEDGLCYAMFEDSNDDIEPEQNIKNLLNSLDRLSQKSRDLLSKCLKIEFDIGYDCGNEPSLFTQTISNHSLRQIAEYNATLRFTLYPSSELKSELK